VISFCSCDLMLLASILEKLAEQGIHIWKPCQWVLENLYALFRILLLSDVCVYEITINFPWRKRLPIFFWSQQTEHGDITKNLNYQCQHATVNFWWNGLGWATRKVWWTCGSYYWMLYINNLFSHIILNNLFVLLLFLMVRQRKWIQITVLYACNFN
jgi:hypothetical protein